MKDYLEKLEIGEEGLTKDQIKGIIAEASKMTTNEVNKIKTELEKEIAEKDEVIKSLNEDIKKSPSADELENLKSKVADYETKEKERKKQEDKKIFEENLNKNVLEAIGDAEFVNERTKNAIINEVKIALQDKANVGKSAKDIFETITKDSTDIFKNKNELSDMPDIQESKPAEGKSTSEGIKINPMFKTDF
jgi:hypothetical protein